MGFGNKGGHTHIDLWAPTALPFQAAQLPHEVDEGLQIGLGFSRQANHEIEFDDLPPLRKGVLDRGADVLGADVFVDHIAQPLAAGFGGDREAGFANGFDQCHQLRGKGAGS